MKSGSMDKPNVVVVIMDDLAYGDLACHGNPYTRTPKLDRLHSESTRLTRYLSGPVCTPARAALFTGRHPYRTRAFDTYLGRSMIDPDEVTLAELLRDSGYGTGLFGKWHLGDCYPCRPIDKGFEECVMHRGGGLCQPSGLGRESYFDPDLVHNGQLRRYYGYCTDIFFDEALKFIEDRANEPFFAYIGTNAPHNPLDVAEDWSNPYSEMGLSDSVSRLYGMVENIDHNVGRLTQKLDELGIAENTILIYTSDHGPCGSSRDEHGRIRFNAGLRGTKTQLYEGGIKVPFFIRWTGKIATGRDIARLANPIDLLPTLCAAATVDPPSDRRVDGENLLPLLKNEIEATALPERTICMQWHRGDAAERYRNYAVIGQRYKLHRPAGVTHDELFDLHTDPAEARDISQEHPEIVASMRLEYERWFDDVSSTRPDNYAPPRIVIGTGHESPTGLTRQDWRLYGDEEGWDADHPGFWLVEVAATGAYSLLIETDDLTGMRGATLHFKCGNLHIERETTWRDDVPRSSNRDRGEFAFQEVELERGVHTLEAFLEVEGQRKGVFRVTIGKHSRVADKQVRTRSLRPAPAEPF
jgi:arylsulfatase A-like enzyme